MIDIDEKIEDSLELFLDLLGYRHIYEFPEKCHKWGIASVKTELKLPEFSERNFTKFVKWFNAFEFYVRWRSLTKEGTCMFIRLELSPMKQDLIDKVLKESNITTLLQIEIFLVRALFTPKILNKSILRVSTDPYEQTDVDEIVTEFIQRCRELFIASLSFLKPNYFVNEFLVLRLLSLLPVQLRVKIEEKISDLDKVNISQVVDIILREKNDLDLDMEMEYSKCCSMLNTKEKKQDKGFYAENQANHLNYVCYCCGEKGHVRSNCRHRSERCNRCKKVGHLSKVCRYEISKDQPEFSKIPLKEKGKITKERFNQENLQLKLQETLEQIQKRLEELEKLKIRESERKQKKREKKISHVVYTKYSGDSSDETESSTSVETESSISEEDYTNRE